MGKSEYKIEIHCHTAESSSCGRVPAAETVSLYKGAGYDGIVITDHLSTVLNNNFGLKNWEESINCLMKGYTAAKEEGDRIGIKVYLGAELRFDNSPNDYLLMGIDEDFLRNHPNLYNLTLEECYPIIKEAGAMIIQAHPYRQPCQPADSRFLDGMEIYNGHAGHDSHNELAEAYASQNGLIPTAGSDCHYYHAIGTAAMFFPLLPEDTKEICQLLKKGDYRISKTGK